MRANSGNMDSTPVKMFGAALGKLKVWRRLRIAGMTHSGTWSALSSSFLVLRGVLRPLSGVFGVVLADAAADVAFLLGVCGSRVVSGAGSALLR
jgi:hypothetical protein